MITRNFKEQDKLFQEYSKYRYYCSCGHTVLIFPMEKREKKLCSHCGKYVYKDKEKQKKYNFKIKMKAMMGKII